MFKTALVKTKKHLKKISKDIKRFRKKKPKTFLTISLGILLLILSFSLYIYLKPKPNDDIFFLDTNNEAILGNKNPSFNVNFGKREEPDTQWVRFEAKSSSKNPFEEKKENIFTKIVNLVKPRKEYGIEMSLEGVKLSETEKLEEADSNEVVKSVAEIIGTDDISTSTELIESGRVIGEYTEDPVSKKTVLNKGVADGVDIEYQILEGLGLKEEIVIRDLEAYTKDCGENLLECKLPLNEFVFDIRLDEGLQLKRDWSTIKGKSTENYYFEDENGNYVAHFLPSWAIDSAGDKTYDVILDVEEKEDGNYRATVIVDINWLFSSGRVYPVRIDPSIVHDTQNLFDEGIFERTLSATGPKVQLDTATGYPSGTYTSSTLDLSAESNIDSMSWTESGVHTGGGETPYSTTGLLAQWNFNETSGTTAVSGGTCGTSCNGTLANMTTTGQDAALSTGWTSKYARWGDGAVMFDGSNDVVNLGSASTFSLQTFTVESWFWINKGGTILDIFSTHNSSGYKGYVFRTDSSGKIYFVTLNNTGGGVDSVVDSSAAELGRWYHGVVTVEQGTAIKLYVDGKLVDTDSSITDILFDATHYAVIGGRYGRTTDFNGVIDSTRFYNRVLSEAEIYSNYQSGNIEFQYRSSTDGSTWGDWMGGTEVSIDDMDGYVTCTGGNTISDGTHIFTSGGTLSCPQAVMVDVLLVGGGGGGGNSISGYGGAGGGGGGGLVFYSNHSLSSGNYSIAIGSGGAVNTNGGNTTFTGLTTAIGGGAGGSANYSDPGSAGGAGGGGGWGSGAGGAGSQGGNGVSASSTGADFGGGGGGGSSGSGTNGGAGSYYGDVFGTDVGVGGYFRGGGGSGGYSGNEGTGGIGGGGAGSAWTAGGIAGTENTGGGGGGGYNVGPGAAGGSGIVIVKILSTLTKESDVINISQDTNIKQEGDGSTRVRTGALEVDSNTVGLWHLDETGGTGAYIKDYSGNDNHGTPTGTTYTNGKVGGARSFNGSSDNVVLGASTNANVTGNITIEGWIKPSSFTSAMGVIHKDYQYAIYINTSGYVAWADSSNWSFANFGYKNIGLTTGVWQHLSVTKSGSTVKIYLNGVEKVSQTFGSAITSTSNIMHMGCYAGVSSCASSYFNGSIDELRISNIARTSDEIYQAYMLSKDQYVNNDLETSVDLTSYNKLPFHIASDKQGTNIEYMVGESSHANYLTDANTVGLWHLDESTGTGAYLLDSSGNGFHGTPTGTSSVTGKLGSARDLAGGTDRITIAHNAALNITTNLSIEAWINPDAIDTGGSWTRLVEKGVNNQYGFSVTSASGYGMIIRLYGTTTVTTYSYVVPPLGVWSHVAVTYDGSNVRFYLNGQLVSQSGNSGSITTTTNALVLGNWTDATRGLNGRMDEVRISNKTRTDEEIKQAYEFSKRRYQVTVDLKADLQSSNLIANSSDTSFTISETAYGSTDAIENLNKWDKIIVRENSGGTDYRAQGTVDSVDVDTGAVTVIEWDTGSTFPSGGYTTSADVFKWQEEFFDTRDILPNHIDAVTNLTFRILTTEAANYWIDDMRAAKYITSSDNVLINPAHIDYDFMDELGTGFNDEVTVIAIQSDGKILMGGYFTNFNGTETNRIIRLNPEGSVDETFDPGVGANNRITAITVQNDGKILIGGSFTSYDGVAVSRFARLNSDGSIDTGFDTGYGADDRLSSIGVQSTGKIILAGHFWSYYNYDTRYFIARSNVDGTVDESFPGGGFDGVVYDLKIQSDDKIVIGGNFYEYNGDDVYQIGRLNSDGTLDTSFVYNTGVSGGSVSAVTLQTDGKVLIGGGFTSFDGTSINRIARLNTDGTLDSNFNPGTGANGYVTDIAVQADGKILIVGDFTQYNGSSVNRIARLNIDGSLDMDFSIGTGLDYFPESIKVTSDGKILIGGSFTSYNGNANEYVLQLKGDTEVEAKYLQYRAVFTTTDEDITPWISQVQVDYTPVFTGPTMDQIMRHGKWFGTGQKQNFWWSRTE